VYHTLLWLASMCLVPGTPLSAGVLTRSAIAEYSCPPADRVGMAAITGARFLTATRGALTIDAAFGQAFLSDSSGYIGNNGQIKHGAVRLPLSQGR
ncbi:hypothetical protein, partial [Salmonella enterica]|uniref:hypothetical protein n=1 Tax=Salmonella enterica TaxID=28901 RepID=UPI00398C24DD